MLYGSSPYADKTAVASNLQPVMTLQSHLIATHDIASDQSIGYGSLYKTTRPTRLGIVAMGYGDGYPRAVTHSYVAIRGRQAPILGRVSMDMLAVDLTDLPVDIQVDEPVVLWGQYPSVDDIASCNNTIGYELLCKVTKRPMRIIKTT
jgi:alanine racemase